APAVAGAAPADFVGGERVVAAAGGRCDARRDHDRIVERAGEERRGHGGREVMVGVAVRAVHHDERAAHVVVAHVERSRSVDERPRGAAAERDPFGAGGGGGGAHGGRRCRRTRLLRGPHEHGEKGGG